MQWAGGVKWLVGEGEGEGEGGGGRGGREELGGMRGKG